MVINLSLGADIETTEYNALDMAIEAAVGVGVTVVTAAGNEGIDASTITPAHTADAITVGAYDANHQFAWFSNYGPTVDILAPGVDVSSLGLYPNGNLAYVWMDGTSQAAAHVAGAAALFLAEHPNASPQQVRDALVASGLATIEGVPAGTTNLTVYVGPDGTLDDIEIPPFFQYAVTSEMDIDFTDGVTIYSDHPLHNASIFTNNKIKLKKRATNHVEGFGYYVDHITGGDPEVTFLPNYNPANLLGHQQVDPVEIPDVDVKAFSALATQTTHGHLNLSGHYDLGTRDAPVIWYVTKSLKTKGDVTFSGYGVFLVKGKIDIKHHLTTSGGPTDESSLGLYTNGKIEFKERTFISAQLFAGGDVTFKKPITLYGSITTAKKVKFKNATVLHYRPASPALTEPFWPINPQ